MQGIKIVFRNGNDVLAQRGKDGVNLPSALIEAPEGVQVTGDDVRGCAHDLLKRIIGKSGELKPVFRGKDDEFGISSSYLSDWSGTPRKKTGLEWASPRDVLMGKWGLFARDVFNALGMMNRPRLDLKRVYAISSKGLNNQSADVTEAIDMIMDEVALLLDIGKPWAVDAILREVDVRRLHADVIDALRTVVENVPGLPSKPAFMACAEAQIAEIDKGRAKIRFGSHGDVRSAALKIYRKKGAEFGDALRAGKLSEMFPYMKHIADAEARMKEDGSAPLGRPDASDRPQVPYEDWPEEQKTAVAMSGPRVDVIPRELPKDPRGVTSEVHVGGRGIPIEFDPDRPETDFTRQIRAALEKVTKDHSPATIRFDEEVCPSCSAQNQAGRFCSHCGHKMSRVRRCLACLAEAGEADKFCRECGVSVAPN